MQALSPPAVRRPSPSTSCHHGRRTESPLAEPKSPQRWQRWQPQLHGLSRTRGRRAATARLAAGTRAWRLPGVPQSPGSTRHPVRERWDEQAGSASVPTLPLLFTPARRPWQIPRRARRRARACRESAASSRRRRGWGGSAARRRAAGPRLRCVPGAWQHCRGAIKGSPQPLTIPRCTKRLEKQLRSSCLPSRSQAASRRMGA